VAKQVEDIVVRLVGEGFEALDKIKGSFRELGKVTNLAEKDILSARDSLLDFAKKAGNTEAVNKGLTDAFKGLRSQVDLSSEAYRSLSGELRRLDEESKGATRSVMAQRDAVLSSTAAGTQNVAALQQQRAALIALRTQTRDASTAFDQFSADIQAVETRLDNLADVNRRFNAVLSQGTAATAAGARVQLEALTAGIALRRQDLADLDTRSARERNLSTTIEQRIGIEQRLNTALSMRRRIQFQEGARTGREGARTGAATFNDPTVTAGFLAPDRIAQRLGDLPNTTAGLSQELGELNERLINTYRNTETYIAVQLRLSEVQRQVSAATQGFGAALRAQLDAGTLVPSQKNLAEVIGQLRREMLELDTTTTEGAQAYANNARQANQLERQLRELANAYQQVGTTATVAATAEQNAANARIRNNYLGRGAVLQQEQALRELGNRVQQGVAATPLLLPAAGQTSAPGTGQARSGGARNRLVTAATADAPSSFVAGVEATFTESLGRRLKTAGERSGYFNPPTAAVGAPPAVGFAEGAGQRDALKATADAARATEQQMQRLRAAVDTATKANTGSVSSLSRLREALVNLRNEIPGTEKEFRDLNQQVEGVDRRSSRLQTRRRPSTGQLVQAGGAAISGGIFGGPEGFLGGVGGAVLGTALPGIGTAGGAFAGAAAGAQVGMFRQQLAGTADYAASIGKLQIALRGVVGSQAAYDAAIRAAAAATRDLNIPQEEATRGLTRLSAAVIGAGGTVADSSFAFRAMSEAIKATGGNAEQVDGALLALTQVFSKGKVSAEELNQIAERLPGTFTLFAQAAGKTGPELQKALEQGEVGLNDLMKFLALTGERYGTTALEIAGSSQDAGARLTVAFQAMRLEVGKALQPLGAELQGAFAAFISEITPAVVGSAKAIAAAISFFTTNEAAGGLARFALQMGAVVLALKGLQAAAAGLTALNLASWFTGAATGVKITGDAAAASTPKVAGFRGALVGLSGVLKSLAAIGVITVTVDILIKNFTQLMAAKAELDRLKKERNPVGDTGPTPIMTAERRFTGASRETVTAAVEFQRNTAARLRKELEPLEQVSKAFFAPTLFAQLTRAQIALKKEQIKNAEAIANLAPSAFKPQAQIDKERAAAATNFPGPAGEDAKDKAADKARRDAEAAAADQQRLNEALAKARIALAHAVFRNDMELIRKRYEYEQELEGKKRDLAVRSKTGGARESAALISSYFGELQTLTSRLTEAGQAVETATQDLKSAKAMAATTVGSAVGGGTSSAQTAQGYISKEQLRAYLISQGMGRTSGDFTNAGHKTPNHMLNAMDMGFTSPKYDSNYVAKTIEMERKLRATGAFGSQLFGPERDPRGHKDHLHIPTEGGRVPLTPGLASLMGIGAAGAGRQPTGVAAAARRDVTAEGEVDTAQANLNKALAEQALVAQQVKELSDVAGKSFVIDYTAAIREQNAALTDSASITQLRNELQLAGERPETIDAEIRKAEVMQRSTQLIADAKTELEGLDTTTAAGAQRATVLRDAIANQNTEIAKFKELTDAATAAQIAFNEAMRTRQDDRIGLGMKEGAQAYVESIGTMREATKDLTLTGIKGVENAIFDLVTTGKTNFREFAADILKQTARMIIQQLVLRSVMQIIGAIGGGGAPLGFGGASDPLGAGGAFWKNANGNAFAKNNIVPYAMGGTFTNSVVSKPTLFKFANGGTTRTGLMGEAGPEAIMPLSRGPNGKLGVSSSGGGGGTTNVTVNVDASGSTAQGDSGKGEQLGRAVSQAVRAELIKQRRPGGILAS
jgi:lambda family phage tail tape measure protein